jgi:LacI family transcriptional regulator
MKRVTLQDVAEHAGVSRAAASMVVRGTGRLSPETRVRVQASMEALGYVYHRGAATLRTNRSGLLGLLLTDVSNPFFSAMTLGFEEVASEAGFMTMVTNTFDEPARQQRLVRAMLEYPVDGFAYTPAVGGEESLVLSAGMSLPVLAITRRSMNDIPSLVPDDMQGGALAAEHLVVVHGARRLVYLGGPEKAGPRYDRMTGVEQTLKEHPGAQLIRQFPGETSIRSGMELSAQLLDSGIEFDAVVCHSDVIAFALLHALRESARSDRFISVIGFDGLPESEVFSPPVTSVAVGPAALGGSAASWILAGLRGDPAVDIEPMTMHLEVRASCGCAPTA